MVGVRVNPFKIALKVIISGLFFWPLMSQGNSLAERHLASVHQTPNFSYLFSTDLNWDHSEKKSFVFIDPNGMMELRQQYQDLNRDYELRRNFGISTYELEYAHTQQTIQFSKEMFLRIRRRQINEQRKSLLSFLGGYRNKPWVRPFEKALRTPLEIVALVLAVYSGRQFEFSLSKSTKLVAMTRVPSREAHLGVFSDWGMGSFDFQASAPSGRNPAAPLGVEPTSRGDEKWKFGLARTLKSLDLTTGLAYWGTSNFLSASLRKQITPQLACDFNYYYPLDRDNSDLKRPGQNLLVSYGFIF